MSENAEKADDRAKIEKAHDAVSRLCKGERWRMSIPANRETDHDLVIAAGLRVGGEALSRAEAGEQKLEMMRAASKESDDIDVSTFVCPECGSWDTEQHGHSDDSRRCNNCDYVGGPGEDFPCYYHVVARARAAEAEVDRLRPELKKAEAEADYLRGLIHSLPDPREGGEPSFHQDRIRLVTAELDRLRGLAARAVEERDRVCDSYADLAFEAVNAKREPDRPHWVRIPAFISRAGDLCGLCDSLDSACSHSRVKCSRCGSEGLQENWPFRCCGTEGHADG